MKDEVLEELWAIKDGIAKECDHDLRKLYEQLKETQRKSPLRTIDRRHLRSKQPLAR